MDYNNSGYPLIFYSVPSSCQNFNLSFILVYDQIFAKPTISPSVSAALCVSCYFANVSKHGNNQTCRTIACQRCYFKNVSGTMRKENVKKNAFFNSIIFINLKCVLCRSRKSSAAGAVLCDLVLLPKTHRGSTQTPCPSTRAQIWFLRAVFGQRLYLKSSPTKETSSPSGWTRRAGCFTESTTPAPCCSSAAFMSLNLFGLSQTSTASQEGSSCQVSHAFRTRSFPGTDNSV